MEFINDEISAYYPNGEKINNDDCYDYAQVKPIDISFSDPEQFETKQNNTENNLSESKPEKFRGPICRLHQTSELLKTDPNQPIPPPRPEKAKKLDTCNKSNSSSYEFNELNITRELSLEEKKSCEYNYLYLDIIYISKL